MMMILNCWLNFSTLNVSLKRSFIGDTRFDDGSFKREGDSDTELAGMEDAEFSQRLSKKGMRLVQNPEIRAFHYHFRSPEKLHDQNPGVRETVCRLDVAAGPGGGCRTQQEIELSHRP